MTFIEDQSYGVIPLKQDGKDWKVLLILHRIGNHWGFPKGHGNPDETPKQAATRELQEETGLKIDRFLLDEPLIEKYQFRSKGNLILKTVHFFPAIVEGELNLQFEEIREAKWVDLRQADKHLSFKEAQRMCDQLIEMLG